VWKGRLIAPGSPGDVVVSQHVFSPPRVLLLAVIHGSDGFNRLNIAAANNHHTGSN
jgi:hypothetical protein